MTAAKSVRILQFGTAGQLGRALIDVASDRTEFSIHALSRDQADFRHPEQIVDAVNKAGSIGLVVNATAYTAVDKAESEPDIARMINARSVDALAQACAARGIPLIHFSTDYVFDGNKATPYLENDEARPLGVYGQTKLQGEKAIRAVTDRHVIVRTSWVYSERGSNFVKTMLRLGAEREELRVVDDQHGAPTSAADLAGAVLTIARRLSTSDDAGLFGTFHYSGGGETTWRRFAEAIFEEAAPWAHIKARVTPITTAEYPTPARRPLNSRLDCAKIERIYGIARSAWRDSLVRVLEECKALGNSGTA